MAQKISKGKGFDLADFREQIVQMEKMGGVASLMDKLPGLSPAAREQVDDRQTRRVLAIINSMTARERRFPDIIRGSRKRRIASGSGTQVQDVNRMLKQFAQMQKMMKQLGKGNLSKIMRNMKGKFPGAPF